MVKSSESMNSSYLRFPLRSNLSFAYETGIGVYYPLCLHSSAYVHTTCVLHTCTLRVHYNYNIRMYTYMYILTYLKNNQFAKGN